MAVIKAAASGNWSATGTWSGGVVPTLNDTVYANGFTVALDQSIDLTGSAVDTSGSFIPGQIYMIVSLGTTNFALTANCIAPGTNAGTAVAITSAVGQIFQAVNAGTATTGTARRMGALLNYVNTPLTITTGGGFTLAASYNITGAYIQAGSANCLTVSAAASSTLAGCHATGSAFTVNTRAISFTSSGTLTLNGIVAIGGRAAGTYPSSGVVAIEHSSATGTVALTNASTLTGGSGTACYGLFSSAAGQTTISNSTILSGASGAIINNSTATITISGSTITAGVWYGIYNNTTGIVTVTSSTVTGGSIAAAYGIWNNSTGTITLTSTTVTGGSNATAYGVNNTSTGPVTIVGDVTASTGSGVNNASTGPVTITGNVTASTAAGVLNASTGTVTITGTLTPTTAVHALQCTNTTGAVITLSGSLIYASNGFAPTNCLKFLMNPTPTMARVRFAKNGSTTYSDFFTADNSLGQAAITDVRFGTVYASGALTGVAYIPSASSVAFGVPVDATTGTATLTAADVRAALGMASANLDTQLSTISTKASEVHAIHGLDIANALTVTPTSRTSGAITQAITGDGTTNTVVTRV